MTPSSAANSGVSPAANTASRRSSGCAYSYGGITSITPWCSVPLVIRSSSWRGASSSGTPCSMASLMDSRTRSSLSMYCATYSALAGTCARSASTTELRPATCSASPLPGVRRAGRDVPRVPAPERGFEAAAARLADRLRPARGRMPGALLGLGRRAAALQALAALAAGALLRALPGARRARLVRPAACAAALGRHDVLSFVDSCSEAVPPLHATCSAAGARWGRARPGRLSLVVSRQIRYWPTVQRGPSGVSSTVTPARASWSRMASEAA